ncbi:MAG: 50S ribosomal protein L18 [Alphaproteobacteria bacterium]|nr:50S ribosomal protein L18 [Alphaproteobacteria bacterium]
MIKKKNCIKSTKQRPRLCVFRSNKHIYAQLIDDESSHVFISCSTLDTEIKSQIKSGATIKASFLVGKTIGQRILKKRIKSIIFDRNDKPYHGRIKAIADGARSIGLKF